MLRYKVVELAVVTEETLEDTLNTNTQQGWHFEGVQFVVREASKRPSMAFVMFTRDENHEDDQSSHFSTSR